jgi:hypothetical protein
MLEREDGNQTGSYRDDDDSVTRDEMGDPQDAGKSTGSRGEDVKKRSQEAGRQDAGTAGPTDRPVGTSTARDSTGVDPQEPIDPSSPDLPRGGG